MIKRKYFFSCRVSHDDGSGSFSWWHNIVTSKSWIANDEDLLVDIRREAVKELSPKVGREIKEHGDIEVISFNRL